MKFSEMGDVMIRSATELDLTDLIDLVMLMWADHSPESLKEEFSMLIKNEHAKVFLLVYENQACGFAQCQLRFDYVEGTESSPVGYLEGIFVKEEYRNRGYATALLRECEAWALSMGCQEFASDCTLDNDNSLQFHLRTGFAEVNRIICFKKTLSIDN